MDIKRLLNKKGWTGRELGILELTNMAVQFKQSLEGEKTKPLIEMHQLQKMVNDLTDPVQNKIYNGYISIHEWLSLKYNIAQTQMQQAQLQYQTLESFITTAMLSEDVYEYVSKLPAIMTQKQYDEAREKGLKDYFLDDEGKELLSDIYNLIKRATHFYLSKLQSEPTKPNPLKAIRKKYISQPVKSKIILDRYNEVVGMGYYTIEDGSGRRSDQMTSEEWRDAVATPKMIEALSQLKASDGNGTEYTNAIARQRLFERYKVIFNGGTQEEAYKAQQEMDYKNGLSIPIKWHTYTEPPTDLTKWDIIEQEILLEIYPFSFDGEDPYTEKNFNASMEDFNKEFPELIAAMLADMDKKYFKGDKIQASKVPVDKWGSIFISWKRLYELDFYGEREEANFNIWTSSGNKRAILNGVAIIKENKYLPEHIIDCEDEYIEPDIESSLQTYSLEALFTESENYALYSEMVKSSRETFIDSYYFILGYNYAIDRIAALYEVPDLEVFKMDNDILSLRMDSCNYLIVALYDRIKEIDYKDTDLQEKKLQVLKDYFQPIECSTITLSEERKKQIDELLEDFKAFKPENLAYFYNLLCTRPQADEGEEA